MNSTEYLKKIIVKDELDYDKELVESLTNVYNEMDLLIKEFKEKEEIIKNFDEYKKYIWRQKDGTYLAIHNIEDDHLLNIYAMIKRKTYGSSREKTILTEIYRRNLKPINREELEKDYDEYEDDDEY